MTAILLSGEIILVNVIVRRSSLRCETFVRLRVIGRVHEWRMLVMMYRYTTRLNQFANVSTTDAPREASGEQNSREENTKLKLSREDNRYDYDCFDD